MGTGSQEPPRDVTNLSYSLGYLVPLYIIMDIIQQCNFYQVSHLSAAG